MVSNMMLCVPFQRDSPPADYEDGIIWRRLKVGNSCLSVVWFCRPAWECFCFHRPVCLSAFLLFASYTCVICSILSRRESLPVQMNTNPNPSPVLFWAWTCCSCSLGQISKKDSGVYEVVLKDDRGKDTSTLNLTDQGEFGVTQEDNQLPPDCNKNMTGRFLF